MEDHVSLGHPVVPLSVASEESARLLTFALPSLRHGAAHQGACADHARRELQALQTCREGAAAGLRAARDSLVALVEAAFQQELGKLEATCARTQVRCR
jgi:hypothetical protein